MLFSIVIPVYGVEPYIDKCLKSIYSQTFSDYEVICVINGKVDDGDKICEDYSNKDNRFRCVYAESAGVSNARNLGVKEAKGDYIWFVDGDDYIEPNSLSILAEKIKKTGNSDIIIFDYYLDLYGNIKKRENSVALDERDFLQKKDAVNALFNFNCCSGFVWNKIYRNDLAKRVSFSDDVHMAEDLLYNTEMFLLAKYISFSKEILYNYVKRDTSISGSFNEKKLSSFIAYERIEKLLNGNQEYAYAFSILNNAKCDFSRWLLCYYYENDRKNYKKVKNKYKKIIIENFKYITSNSAKIAAILVCISPKIIINIKGKNG